MEDEILALLGRHDYTPLRADDLLTQLRLRHNQRRKLTQTLTRLERNGQVARIKHGNRYALPLDADLIPGRIRINRQGAGVVQPTDPRISPLRIPQDATGTAMHGDRVLVRRELGSQARARVGTVEATGRVVRLLERARNQLVGTLQRGQQFLYVIPDDPRIPQDIYVPPPTELGRPARVGDKVVVELKDWKSRHTNPEGQVIEVLGPPDAQGVDMLAVLRQYNLPLHFPKRVLQETRALGKEIHPVEKTGRVDCRSHQVVTIDPEDAKDFDDAICLQKTDEGNWKLWVHIADVSHYVKPGSPLDQEAAHRGNSTYLVDRVIPMLPEALSNELCSLKPHVERLTKCVEFLLSADGDVLKSRFYSAVICSQCRYNYKEVFALLQRQPLDSLELMLHEANHFAQKIRRKRFQTGSLDLDFPESKLILDEQGQVLRIEKVENDVSHQLIEEFMLLANEAVAARLMSASRPAIYRIHEPPDPKRLDEFREKVLAHRIQCGNLSNRHEVQRLLAKLNTLPFGTALKIGFLRSLMRARYAVEPLGHYGLAKKKYTHFTSPIRRYADLVVHRALFQQAGQLGALRRDSEVPIERVSTSRRGPRRQQGTGQQPFLASEPLQQLVEQISETERNSDDAERDSREVKLFAFLIRQLQSQSGRRHQYAALVTDVRNFGFFVDVAGLGLSGLVPLSGLSDDFYVYDGRTAQLVGRRTRRSFKLGDKVDVEVSKVDTFKRQVDFRLVQNLQGIQHVRPQGGTTRRTPNRKRRFRS